MPILYCYSPVHAQPVTLLPGRDSDNPLDVLAAFDGLAEQTFLIDAAQLARLREQLASPPPADTIWGLDPTDAQLSNLGVHPGVEADQLWLRVRPPYTMSHAQAVHLFMADVQQTDTAQQP
jgi:hypothetical protein